MTTVKGSAAWQVACGLCGAAEGGPCWTTSGRLRAVGAEHKQRWNQLRDAYRLPRRYALRDDDARFGLAAGDVLVCEPYRYDPEKLTVLYRESDGCDPGCNVYRVEVEPVRGSAGAVERPAAVLS